MFGQPPSSKRFRSRAGNSNCRDIHRETKQFTAIFQSFLEASIRIRWMNQLPSFLGCHRRRSSTLLTCEARGICVLYEICTFHCRECVPRDGIVVCQWQRFRAQRLTNVHSLVLSWCHQFCERNVEKFQNYHGRRRMVSNGRVCFVPVSVRTLLYWVSL